MTLDITQSCTITLQAPDHYGGDPVISVQAGEQYTFDVPPGQHWYDSYIRCGPDGFFNFLLWFSGRRLKGVSCFTLCGAIGKSENHLFKIGKGLQDFVMPASGELYFFPNDAWDYYHNNRGEMRVTVTRMG